MRAFSSVGRASPLQGEGQKFESSNAHHKKQNDIIILLFIIWRVFKTRTYQAMLGLKSSSKPSKGTNEVRVQRASGKITLLPANVNGAV